MDNQSAQGYRCGFVAVTGRPNVGKSTLVNRIVGMELCAVTRKPQTTRNRITAIANLPCAQMILFDTPGIHEPATPLNRAMVASALKTLYEADAALFLTTPSAEIPEDDRLIMEKLGSAGLPAVLAINKIDMVEPAALLPVIESFSCTYHFEAIIPVSALRGDGLEELTGTLIELLPSGPALYAEDDLSDLPTRFFVAEIVREQVTRLTGREIPYKTAVVVGAFKEGRGAVVIQAEIHVERESQKKIMIGRKGGMLKRIGTESRRKIEHFLDCPVRLELFVKVTPHWTRDPARLEEFGYI